MTNVQSKELMYLPLDEECSYYRLRWQFRSDGTGEAVLETSNDPREGEERKWEKEDGPISFPWNAESFGELTTADLESVAYEIFWGQINSEFSDPFLSDDALDSEEETHFRCGSLETLEKLVKLTLYCYPEVFDETDDEVVVRCYTEYSDASASLSIEDIKVPDAVQRLFDLAMELNTPCGWETAYNDGAYNRRSGYSTDPNSFDIDARRPSAHEIFEAPRLLRKALEKHVSEKDLNKLIPQT